MSLLHNKGDPYEHAYPLKKIAPGRIIAGPHRDFPAPGPDHRRYSYITTMAVLLPP